MGGGRLWRIGDSYARPIMPTRLCRSGRGVLGSARKKHLPSPTALDSSSKRASREGSSLQHQVPLAESGQAALFARVHTWVRIPDGTLLTTTP